LWCLPGDSKGCWSSRPLMPMRRATRLCVRSVSASDDGAVGELHGRTTGNLARSFCRSRRCCSRWSRRSCSCRQNAATLYFSHLGGTIDFVRDLQQALDSLETRKKPHGEAGAAACGRPPVERRRVGGLPDESCHANELEHLRQQPRHRSGLPGA
jgi:hypothetical protein